MRSLFNSMKSIYRYDSSSSCWICNADSPDKLYHLISSCWVYTSNVPGFSGFPSWMKLLLVLFLFARIGEMLGNWLLICKLFCAQWSLTISKGLLDLSFHSSFSNHFHYLISSSSCLDFVPLIISKCLSLHYLGPSFLFFYCIYLGTMT